MCVGQTRRVCGTPEAGGGAMSRNPAKIAATNATVVAFGILRRVALLISNSGHELSSDSSKVSITRARASRSQLLSRKPGGGVWQRPLKKTRVRPSCSLTSPCGGCSRRKCAVVKEGETVDDKWIGVASWVVYLTVLGLGSTWRPLASRAERAQ